nr:pre-mRNA-splicing factor CWC22 homolog [Ipomoea batatas]
MSSRQHRCEKIVKLSLSIPFLNKMDHPILPLPPPEPPAPENPPEKAPPKPHTCNDSAMFNFRALMMKMAIESSPSKSLTPAQTLILEDKLRQCFPYLRAPDHPPYAWASPFLALLALHSSAICVYFKNGFFAFACK